MDPGSAEATWSKSSTGTLGAAPAAEPAPAGQPGREPGPAVGHLPAGEPGALVAQRVVVALPFESQLRLPGQVLIQVSASRESYWPVFPRRAAQASLISKYAPLSSCRIRAEPDQPAKPPVPVFGTMWPNQTSGSDSSPPCCMVTEPSSPPSGRPVIRSVATYDRDPSWLPAAMNS